MARVLVTGASGFLGRTIVPMLGRRHSVRAAVRCDADHELPGQYVRCPEIGPDADWSAALQGIDVVVHLAAIAHVPLSAGADALLKLTSVNVHGVGALARQAARAGARRFIFMSSIKAAGDHSSACALRPDMPPNPEDDYGRAKLRAENLILQIAEESGLEAVILRPPMVFGPNSKGNFALLVNLVRREWPLPFGSVRNRRSLVSVWTLAEVVDRCVDAAVAGRTLHVADEGAVSTAKLVEYIANGLGVAPHLVRVPPFLVQVCLEVVGRADLAQKLLGSLEVDGRQTTELLSWRPAMSVEEAIARAVRESQ